MARIQMLDTPHKALRFAFGKLLTQAGKTDFSQLEEVVALQSLQSDVFNMVRSHSHHEDDICFAALDKIVPNATQHDRSEHERLHLILDALEMNLEAIADSVRSGKDEAITGFALYTHLCVLHAEMLNHMMEEERDTQPIFWEHMTDAQLAAFEPKILASMTPEMSALWMQYIIPSQPMPKVIGMFKGMAATAPPAVVAGNLRLAKSVLSEVEYARLNDALDTVLV